MIRRWLTPKHPIPQELPDYPSLGQKAASGDTEALRTILHGADAGDGDAQLEAGFLYAKGWIVDQSDELAAYWYGKAAAQGVLNAQFNLGCMHYLGEGFERSTKNALHWFEIAADGGHAAARMNVPGMQEEAAFLAQQQSMYDAFGIKKIAGLQNLGLARGYVAKLKVLTQNNEVREALQLCAIGLGVSPSVGLEAQKCITLIRNISSATPLSVDLLLKCAIHNVWEAMDEKLSEND